MKKHIKKIKHLFIDSDLNRNRVFLGKEDGGYEEKIVFYLSKVIKKVDVVIDTHCLL